MQTVRKLRKRSGFTLVELLIVIIIIGILAGAMLLVAGSGTDSAEATKVVSDLRSMKAAALLFYADNSNPPLTFANSAETSLDKYSDMSIKDEKFSFRGDGTNWWVGRIRDGGTGVITKLQGMKDTPLWGTTTEATLPTATDPTIPNDATWIWMKAR